MLGHLDCCCNCKAEIFHTVVASLSPYHVIPSLKASVTLSLLSALNLRALHKVEKRSPLHLCKAAECGSSSYLKCLMFSVASYRAHL